MPTPQELLAQQNQQRSQLQGMQQRYQQLPQRQASMATPTFGDPRARANQSWQNISQMNQLSGQMNAARQGIANTQDQIAQGLRAQNRNEAYDIARGGVSRAAGTDPTDQFIMERLKAAAGPGGGPYDATTRNAMFTQQASMAGHAAGNEGNQILQQAAERGLSADDPAVQAALRRVQGGQAQAAQRARLGIDLEANRANYGAQQAALGQLAGVRAQQRGEQTSAEDRLRQMLLGETFRSGAGAPDYTDYINRR